MNTIVVNGFTAVQYLPGSWNITGPAGQQWYWQGSQADITAQLNSQPATMAPAANGPMIPSANVGNLPDGSTQVEALQQAQQDRLARRAALEPDYIEADEMTAYSNGNPGAAQQLAALQASVLAWNSGLNDLRQCAGLSPLPASAFDGAPIAPASSTIPWGVLLAGGVALYLLMKK